MSNSETTRAVSLFWRKAIPPARDRLQSRLLVGIIVPILCYLVTNTVLQLALGGTATRVVLVESTAVCTLFSLTAWRLRAATPFAAVCGGMVCMLLTEPWIRLSMEILSPGALLTSMLHSALSPLIFLFLLTFTATRLAREQKRAADMEEDHRGRSASQVIANLGSAGLLGPQCSLFLIALVGYTPAFAGNRPSIAANPAIFLPLLAALAEATADTVSSEIGQAFGGTPFLLTTFRHVASGTDGAISPRGTVAGIAAAAIIAAVGASALGMSLTECAVAFLAAVFGLFFDSLLGATVERRGYLGNDLVNFISTTFAAGLGLLAVWFGHAYRLR